jgi:hypothetical protein
MTTKTKTRTEHAERGGRALRSQPNRFVGLFLSPFAGLLTAWLIHVWTLGVNLHLGRFAWVVRASAAAPYVAVSLITAVTIGMSVLAWQFAAHRDGVKQGSLAGSVATLGALFAINVGTGPDYWWSGFFILAGWTVAVVWSLVRLDIARTESRGEGEEEDGLAKKLGIHRKTRFRSKVVHDETTGEPLRVDIDVQHAPGETVSVLQDGLESIESVASGPAGMSTAVGDPDHADQSHMSVMLANPFRRNIPVGPLTSPGGSIADWATVAEYADGKPGFVTTAPGKHMPSATSYGLIGATRAGKTGTETQLLTEWGSRYDWTCLYLNQAKGLQDIRPLLPIIEAAVIAEDGEKGLSAYVAAILQIKAIMIYRQQELARFAVSAWSPRCCDPNPDRRPTAIVGGKRVPMERMPFFTGHFGEADAILASGKAAGDAEFVASKGLSLGVNTGWSLQRPDWKNMPTGLRANIGLWFVHGMNGSDEEEFVLDESVRKAGASPGKWGQRKPGQHFMVGPGIDETQFPVALKTRFLVGSDRNPDGTAVDFDTLNDRYMAEMLRRNLASAPRMVKLDRGSVEATDGWWEEQAAKTVDLRARMLTAESPASSPHPAPRKSSPLAGVPTPQDDDESADEMTDEEREEAMSEFEADAAETTEVEGIPLYGDNPQEQAEAMAVDLTVPFQPPATDYDPLEDSAEDDKPEAKTREEAQAALRRTLVAMANNPKYADRKVPGTALVTVTDVFNELGLRSRPWVSEELARVMATGGEAEDGVVMERHGNPNRGGYRIRRLAPADHGK